MGVSEEVEDSDRLQDLVADMEDMKSLLDGTTGLAAAALSKLTGVPIECSVTLRRRRRPATIAGSSDRAILLDGIEQRLGEGPCLEALRTGAPVLLECGQADKRWLEFQRELTNNGFTSVLGIPLELGKNASAALDFFAAATGAFTEETIQDADRFGFVTSKALRLGLRIATAEIRAGDLTAALNHRHAINTACGIIMAQNRCTEEEVFNILKGVSSTRNQKLHDVAQGVVEGFGGAPQAHFDS